MAVSHSIDRRIVRRGLWACLGVLALGFAGGNRGAAEVFNPETFTLDNGMQVVVVTNRRAPIVTHMVWYKVGAADEAAGESGNAHFLEHLLFKGTKTLAPGEFSKTVAANGGRENAFTSYDYTGYYQSVARDRLEIVMGLEADRMANLVLNDEIVLPERDVVIEERRSRVDNEPAGKLGEMVQAALFLNHPYRIPVIGWKHEIEALTTETALAFYRRWYAPNNAVLVIGGDVTAEDVRPLAEATYGKIPARAVPERRRVEEPPQSAPRRVTLTSDRVRQPSLSIAYVVPGYANEGIPAAEDSTGDDALAYALQVLDEILGGGSTSRLYRTLVVEQGLAASAGSNYSPSALDWTTFSFYTSPRPGVEFAELEAALRSEIARLLEQGVSAEEVETAKRRLHADAVYVRDSVSAAPRIFGIALTTGGSVARVESWPEGIAAVTPEQVEEAARAVLVEERSVTGVLRAGGSS
jgi:zinc protease